MAHVRSVQAKIGWTELFLDEAIEVGVEIDEAASILDQARQDLAGDHHTLALERCRMAREMVVQSLTGLIAPLLDEIESAHGLAMLSGEGP